MPCVGMDVYCCLEQLVGNPNADPEGLTDVLLTIWARTLLVRDPLSPTDPGRRRGN